MSMIPAATFKSLWGAVPLATRMPQMLSAGAATTHVYAYPSSVSFRHGILGMREDM